MRERVRPAVLVGTFEGRSTRVCLLTCTGLYINAACILKFMRACKRTCPFSVQGRRCALLVLDGVFSLRLGVSPIKSHMRQRASPWGTRTVHIYSDIRQSYNGTLIRTGPQALCCCIRSNWLRSRYQFPTFPNSHGRRFPSASARTYVCTDSRRSPRRGGPRRHPQPATQPART